MTSESGRDAIVRARVLPRPTGSKRRRSVAATDASVAAGVSGAGSGATSGAAGGADRLPRVDSAAAAGGRPRSDASGKSRRSMVRRRRAARPNAPMHRAPLRAGPRRANTRCLRRAARHLGVNEQPMEK